MDSVPVRSLLNTIVGPAPRRINGPYDSPKLPSETTKPPPSLSRGKPAVFHETVWNLYLVQNLCAKPVDFREISSNMLGSEVNVH